MTSHSETASAFLSAAQEARRQLDVEYGEPGSPGRRDPVIIGKLQQSIRFALAAGKLEAQLATAEATERAAARIIAAAKSSPAIDLEISAFRA